MRGDSDLLGHDSCFKGSIRVAEVVDGHGGVTERQLADWLPRFVLILAIPSIALPATAGKLLTGSDAVKPTRTSHAHVSTCRALLALGAKKAYWTLIAFYPLVFRSLF